MTEDLHREDRWVLDLLEAPDPVDTLVRAVGEGEEERALTEVVGLLAVALPPVAPRPDLRRELLARVAEARAAETGAVQPPRRPAPPVASERGASGGRTWTLRLAAALILGLVGATFWLFGQLQEQRRMVDGLAAEVERLGRRNVELASIEGELSELQMRLGVVSSPGAEVCPLNLVAPEGGFGDARGVLYVAGDHQHWYIALHGLAPSPEGRSYQLWFIAEQGPVSAGTFHARLGEQIELSSETMPAGTSAVSVTLEDADGSAVPSGPQVLFGNQVMRLL